jgi:hypothetical protein
MELDIFVPSLSLAFEYQGQQHFSDESSVHYIPEQVSDFFLFIDVVGTKR